LITFVLSLLDLTPLKETPAVIDTSMQITPEAKKPRLPPDFVYPENAELHEGLIQVKSIGWLPAHTGFADSSGRIKIKPNYDRVEDFNEGRAIVTVWSEKMPMKFGALDRAGNLVIKPQYDSLTAFHHGRAVGTKDKQYYLIDQSGHVIFTNKLDNTFRNSLPSDSSAFDKDEKGPQGILTPYLFLGNGTPVFRAGENYIASDQSNKFGILDRDGHWKVSAQYDQIIPMQWDMFTGTFKLPNREEYQNSFPSGALAVEKDKLWGLLDADGKTLIPPKFERILSYQNGHAAAMLGGKYGFCDEHGNMVIEPAYDFVTAFDDIIAVKSDSHWHFIDSKGLPLATPAIDGVVHSGRGIWLSEGLGQVIQDNKVGFLNKQGQLQIKPSFDWALGFKKGKAVVYDRGRWHYIDKTGQRVSPDLSEAESFFKNKASVSIPGPLFSFISFNDGINRKGLFKRWRDLICGRVKDNYE